MGISHSGKGRKAIQTDRQNGVKEWQDEMRLGTSMRHKILNPGVKEEHAGGGCWLRSTRSFIQAEVSL